ncbi:MAG: heparinase II/III domain-containing protein, partial [Alphaproteobacteria bacterium]
LNIDGEDWVSDPGSYLYTPSPERRDAYRSVHAHGAPKLGAGEPSRLDFGLFRLQDNAHARCLVFSENTFEGVHQGYGQPLYRRVEIAEGHIRIIDGVAGSQPSHGTLPPHAAVTVRDAAALRKLWSLDLPFSPAYGEVED